MTTIFDKEKIISPDEAFRAMILFLSIHYKRFESDDIATVLSELQIVCSDGGTADPAAEEDWIECLEKAMKDHSAGRSYFILKK